MPMESKKRKSPAVNCGGLSYDEPAEEHLKRPRNDKKQKQSSQARVDPTYGQRSAFPGLDSYSAYAEEDDDLEYGDDIEALQYLQSVRNEAASIPTLLVAPRPVRDDRESPDRSIYEDGTGDSRGFYSEGAYVGASTMKECPNSTSGDRIVREAQPVYFETLLKRFHRLHALLSTLPPQIVIDGLSSNHPSFMSNSREDLRSWRWRLFNTDPQPAQIAIMDKGTVFRLLRLILTNNGTLGGKTLISQRLSRWIWGLLAKVPVSGELMSEEIGLIRELGKRAVWLGVEMRGVDIRELFRDTEDVQQLDKETEDDGDDEEIAVDFELDDGNSAGSETITDGNRIIGPVVPNKGKGVLDAVEAAGNTLVEESEASLPVVYGSRAEALLAPQIKLDTNPDIEVEVEEGKAANHEDEARIASMRERLLARLEQGEDDASIAKEVDGTAEPAQEVHEYTSDLDNARITVDMIITIAGEVYGQRDLLEFREEWD